MSLVNKIPSIFVHVPKCGGLSMELLCRENCILIDPVNNDCEKLNKKYSTNVYINKNECGKVKLSYSFVRNPYDRAVSAWKCPWVSGSKIKKKWKVDEGLTDFKGFVNNFILKESRYTFFRWSHVMPFTDPRMKLFDKQGEMILDFIGRLENYQEDFDTVCDKIGIPRQQLPHKNKTKHKHYTEYYDNETREIVAEKYAKDIEYFGYEFGKT